MLLVIVLHPHRHEVPQHLAGLKVSLQQHVDEDGPDTISPEFWRCPRWIHDITAFYAEQGVGDSLPEQLNGCIPAAEVDGPVVLLELEDFLDEISFVFFRLGITATTSGGWIRSFQFLEVDRFDRGRGCNAGLLKIKVITMASVSGEANRRMFRIWSVD